MKQPLHLLSFCFLLVFANSVQAQTVSPVITFEELPLTHNMHIASDGKFLYTCNGGVAENGQISKYTLTGEKIASYKYELDMRSILYNADDRKLYVTTYDQRLIRINDLMMGTFSEVWTFDDRDGQSTPAFNADGKLLYFYDDGDVYIYDFKTKELKETLTDLGLVNHAPYGSTAIAVDAENIYTWNGEEKILLAFDLKGKPRKAYQLEKGDYAFSLSVANGLVWVSTDGNYETGTWYGYKIL